MTNKVYIYRGSLHERLNEFKALKQKGFHGRLTGPYFIDYQSKDSQRGFYLNSDFQPAPRWAWCDEAKFSPGYIEHKGWFCNEDQTETIRGVVFYLPHGRYMSGWSMGVDMASGLEKEVYCSEILAIRAADALAAMVAEEMIENEKLELEREHALLVHELNYEQGNGKIRKIFSDL